MTLNRSLIEVVPKVNVKIILETLTRIGIAKRQERVLYPSCYLYQDEDSLCLVHFKELFTLLRDDSYDNMSDKDILRRNAIAFCLKNWGLVDLLEPGLIDNREKFVFVLSKQEKPNWSIEHKISYRFNGETD